MKHHRFWRPGIRLTAPIACLIILTNCAKTTSFMSAGELTKQLRAGHFDRLDTYFAKIQQEHALNTEGYRPLALAYENAPSDPALLTSLDSWCAQRPQSHFARTLRGILYSKFAWKARGDSWGYTVTPLARQLYAERLNKAQADLERAYVLDPTDPYPPAELLIVARGLYHEQQQAAPMAYTEDAHASREPKKPWTREDMEAWFHKAVQADPLDLTAYVNKLAFLMPKWYGSAEEVLTFARQAASSSSRGSPIPLLIILAHWELAGNNPGYFTPEIRKEIQETFARLEEDFPHANRFHAWHGVLATFAGERDFANAELNRVNSYASLKYAFLFGPVRGTFLLLGRLPDFERHALAWSRAHPRLPDPLYELGLIFFERDEIRKAEGYYRKAIALAKEMLKRDPMSSDAYHMLGASYFNLDADKSIDYYLKYLTLVPNDVEAYWTIGRAYLFKKKQYDKAIEFFQKGLEFKPLDGRLLVDAAEALNLSGKTEAAIELYRAQLQLDPYDANGHYSFGRLFDAHQQYDEALAEYSRVVELDPFYGLAYYAIGNAFCGQGRCEDGLGAFEHYIALNPPGCTECVTFAKRVVQTLRSK